MAKCYTIGQYQYNIYFGEEGLSLKAINYKSLVDYRCDIEEADIKDFRLISSLDTLYEILNDAFTGKNTSAVVMKITYDEKKDEINILLCLKYKYASETLEVNLRSVKELVNQRIIDNKMHYFNKRLTDLEGERKEIDELKLTVLNLSERLAQLETSSIINNDYITYMMTEQSPYGGWAKYNTSALYVPLATMLTVSSKQLTVGSGKDYNVIIKYLSGVSMDCYIRMCNYLTELKSIDICKIDCEDLKFIEKCTKTEELSLENLLNLVDISSVLNFLDLKFLTIKECRKINNLKILEKCKSLELLKVHSTINTGVFSEVLSFRIEIIA